MNTTTLILVGLAIALLIYALIRDQQVAVNGLKLAGSTLWRNLIMLLAGFIIAGLMQALLPKELISQWLGAKSGGKGIWIACLIGGLFPGSPYSTFPIVASLYEAGAGLGAIVGFVTAWALWSVTRLPIEIALLDPKVALIRYAITFIVPPAAGYLAHGLNKLII